MTFSVSGTADAPLGSGASEGVPQCRNPMILISCWSMFEMHVSAMRRGAYFHMLGKHHGSSIIHNKTLCWSYISVKEVIQQSFSV